MQEWRSRLGADPLPPLMAAGDPALSWRVRHELLGQPGDPAGLWELPAVRRLLRRQESDGRWRYTGRRTRPATDYDQLATYEALLELVGKHLLDVRHPAVEAAAGYLLAAQAAEGDLRGMYGTQYATTYTAAMLAVLLDAGIDPDADPMRRAIDWLLRSRQADGGWAIPFRTRLPRTGGFDRVMALAEPLEPDRTRPSSHLVTGLALRALAAHPVHRTGPEAARAALLLSERLFCPDAYPDRRAAGFWEKLRFPYRWTDVLSVADATLATGAAPSHPLLRRALPWLAGRQGGDGLWRSGYGKAADPHVDEWTSFAAARVMRRTAGRDL